MRTRDDAESGRAAPRSRRGRQTSAAPLTAAREVFEGDGFLDARISDIAKAAGVATGSNQSVLKRRRADHGL